MGMRVRGMEMRVNGKVGKGGLMESGMTWYSKGREAMIYLSENQILITNHKIANLNINTWVLGSDFC